MIKKLRCARIPSTRCCAALVALTLCGCAASDSSFLAPHGLVAALQRRWMLEVCLVLGAVLLPIFVVLPAILWRYRSSDRKALYRPEWHYYTPLEIFIWAGPCVIVAGLAFLIAGPQARYSPENRITADPPLQIQAVAMDWKWLFIYPDQHLATVDTLPLPANHNIEVTLTSVGTMQSFFIPALSGQLYAMAGMVTRLNFRTGQPADLLGENTQFNGVGFQAQKFRVHVLQLEGFDSWVRKAAATASPLTPDVYNTLQKPGTLDDLRKAMNDHRRPQDASQSDGLIYTLPDSKIFARIVQETQEGAP